MTQTQTGWNRSTRFSLLLVLVGLVGCRQEMASQPSYRPLAPSKFFPDGRSVRPLVLGTVARGSTQESGLRNVETADWLRIANLLGAFPGNPLGAARETLGWSQYVDTFPFPISMKELERGQERFNIYCAVCHDRTGYGRGMIVQRGFTAPPSYHTDYSRGFKLRGIDVKLTEAPVGYYFEVITHGFGAMSDYAHQVTPADRWKIIAYIRALQLSQSRTLEDIQGANEKQRLTQLRGAQK